MSRKGRGFAFSPKPLALTLQGRKASRKLRRALLLETPAFPQEMCLWNVRFREPVTWFQAYLQSRSGELWVLLLWGEGAAQPYAAVDPEHSPWFPLGQTLTRWNGFGVNRANLPCAVIIQKHLALGDKGVTEAGCRGQHLLLGNACRSGTGCRYTQPCAARGVLWLLNPTGKWAGYPAV